jgi:NADPH2:quinone reductase
VKAILIRRPGGPDVLEYTDVPTPSPCTGEILVRAEVIGVNRPEILVRRGIYPWMPPLPAILGIEMVGRVAALGAGVVDFAIGEPVLVSARELPVRAGCYAEFIAVPAAAVYRVPRNCDLEQAACLANYQVASLLLSKGLRGSRAQTMLVLAASGGIGSALVDLGKAQGRTVVASVSSAEKAHALHALRTDHFVLSSAEDWEGQVREATNGAGVDVAFDPIGGETLTKVFSVIAPFGMVISYGRLAGREQGDIYEAMFKYQEASPSFSLFTMHSFDHRQEVRRQAMDEVLQLLSAGTIAPIIHTILPLSEAGKAHDLLESRALVGKVLLKP